MLRFACLSATVAASPLYKAVAEDELPQQPNTATLISPGPRAKSETKDTKRLQRAMDQAQTAGGGTVFIPAGHYISGSLYLRSNVSLWLDNGVVLTMSPDTTEFLPVEKLSYETGANQATSDFHFALFVGDGVEHISIGGEGIIECDRGAKGSGPKPIALRSCMHVNLSGITIRNAQNYNISLLGCQFVDMDGITILRGHADGVDPDCCRYVRISNCFIESADDSLCLKASNSLGQRSSTEYVTVTNCILRTASIHFKCGTESCGDFRNIAISNCVFEGGAGFRHGNPGVAFYTTDEGALENITVSNITMRDVGTPIAIIRGDRDRCSFGKGPGTLKAVRITDILATGARLPSVIAGLPDAPVEDVFISGVSISMAAARAGRDTLDTISEKPKAYPEPVMFGELPAFGLFLRHVKHVRLQDIVLSAPPEEMRPDIVADDVAAIRLTGYEKEEKAAPVHLWLNNVRDSFVECIAVSEVPSKSYRISGPKTQGLFLRSGGSLDWHKHLAIGADVEPGAVRT